MNRMWFQELLNECIDIQEHNKIVKIFKEISKVMKQNKKELAVPGKHF